MFVKKTSRKQKLHNRRKPGQPIATPARILAVDPGSRYMGLAFLIGADLVRADVENVREPGMRSGDIAKKANRVLSRWIRRYQPDVLAIESPFFAQSRHSSHVQGLIKAITALAHRERLLVQRCPPTTARKFICKQGRATRLATAQVIATEYFPWLHPYYQKEANRSWWKQRYWTSMFDAIAVGLACNGKKPDANTHGQAA